MLLTVLAIIFSPLIFAACGLLIASQMRTLRWLIHLTAIPAILVVGPVCFIYASMGIGPGFFVIMAPMVIASLGIYLSGAVLICDSLS